MNYSHLSPANKTRMRRYLQEKEEEPNAYAKEIATTKNEIDKIKNDIQELHDSIDQISKRSGIDRDAKDMMIKNAEVAIRLKTSILEKKEKSLQGLQTYFDNVEKERSFARGKEAAKNFRPKSDPHDHDEFPTQITNNRTGEFASKHPLQTKPVDNHNPHEFPEHGLKVRKKPFDRSFDSGDKRIKKKFEPTNDPHNPHEFPGDEPSYTDMAMKGIKKVASKARQLGTQAIEYGSSVKDKGVVMGIGGAFTAAVLGGVAVRNWMKLRAARVGEQKARKEMQAAMKRVRETNAATLNRIRKSAQERMKKMNARMRDMQSQQSDLMKTHKAQMQDTHTAIHDTLKTHRNANIMKIKKLKQHHAMTAQETTRKNKERMAELQRRIDFMTYQQKREGQHRDLEFKLKQIKSAVR